MTQSPEYPDLTWMPPKSWTDANRTSVQLVVIHTTEGSEGPASAEEGASYDQRRTDGTSCHFFHDSNSTVQCVRTNDIAHAARHQGNLRGIQHELCGRAGQGSTGWADPVSQGTLRQAAKQVARDCKKWGIPVRKLSAGQVASGLKGLCGHVDITYAFPQDNGTHTDPGPTFPWPAFLALVQDFMDGEQNMDLTADNLKAIARAVWGQEVGASGRSAHDVLFGTMYPLLQAAVADDVDEAAVAKAVLAGMDYRIIADAVVAALPKDQAQQFLDALTARLAA